MLKTRSGHETAPARVRRALIVGGSGGIGRETAFELASLGNEVVVHGGHSAERLERTVEAVRADGGKASGFLLDIRNPGEFIVRLPEIGHIDILVVAFGPFVRKSLTATTTADWERLALLDLALPGALVSHYLPIMKERGWGRILLFGGTKTDTIHAYSSNAAYASAKTGLAVLTKSAAAWGSPYGIGCIQICPGFVETEYLDDVAKNALSEKAPGGILMDARHLASQAIALLLAEPCIASGAILSMDSGLVL